MDNIDDSLAEEAEQELDRLKKECEASASGYSEETREALYRSFRAWVEHPMFRQYPGMLG